jgi:hypothetical protein
MDIVEYEGVIVEESLENTDVLRGMKIINSRVTDEAEGETWHIHKVKAFLDDFEALAKNMRRGWYMHFWKDAKGVVIFKGKTFWIDYDNKATWKPAIEFGLSKGIPEAQLDFVRE